MLFLLLAPLFQTVVQAALAYKGVDWSSTLVEEAAGKSWKNTAGAVQPLETILKNSGVNTVRQRLWVNPPDGNYNLNYNLKLANRAKVAGLQIYLDIHYSDTWADPGKQGTPAAWTGYNIDNLAWEVYNYTKASMDAFQSAGLPLSMVSIGNEITNGMLWPLGQTSKSSGYYNLARLLHSASSAIKDSMLTPKPQIMIHLDNGWSYSTQQNWYDNVLKQGPLVAADYDIQGVSYYPFYNTGATLASLKSSLTSMKSKYGKAVMVVETDWPTYCPQPSHAFPSDAANIPFTPEGQTTWMQKVAGALTAAGGNGLFYWEPAWIDNANLGSSCPYNLMFDDKGGAMSSINVFQSI